MAKRSRIAIREAAERACAAFATATPDKTLGDLLFWDFSSGWGEPCDAVRDAWIAMGLDPDADLPPVTDEPKAFRRAVEHAQRGICTRHDCRTVELPPKSAGETRIAIMKITRNGTAKGETVGIVSQTGSFVDVVQPDPYGIAEGIKADTFGTFRGRYAVDDVRSAVTAVLDRWAATPCRQAPPHIVYYLPAPGADTIRRVRDALAKVGAGSIHLAPMGTDAESRETAASAANGGIESQLSAFAAEAEQWTSKAPSRASTVENRIGELSRLREKGALYRRILGDVVSDVDGRIAAIEASMRATLGIVETAKEARA